MLNIALFFGRTEEESLRFLMLILEPSRLIWAWWVMIWWYFGENDLSSGHHLSSQSYGIGVTSSVSRLYTGIRQSAVAAASAETLGMLVAGMYLTIKALGLNSEVILLMCFRNVWKLIFCWWHILHI